MRHKRSVATKSSAQSVRVHKVPYTSGVIQHWIDDNLDHRMILCSDDPAVPVLRELGEPMYLLDVNPTAENIAKLIFDFTTEQHFPIVSAKMWETTRCYPSRR